MGAERPRGRPRFANVHALGIAQAAREVSERIYSKRGSCKVWILKTGDVAIRQCNDSAYREPSARDLVGVYTRRHSTWQLMEDMSEHLRSIAE